jgi:hypothetical protein
MGMMSVRRMGGAFAKWRQAIISLRHVRLSVPMKDLGSNWADFH